VSLAAKFAEVPLEDFKALNPSVTKPVLLAAGTPQILLPWDNAKLFQGNLEAYTEGRLANWTAWIAPSTLKPVDAARKVGMTEVELRTINQIPANMLIRAGSTLVVRRHPGMDVDVSEHVADNGQLSLAPVRVARKTTVKARKKETVTSLARRYKLDPEDVASWNKLTSSAVLKNGQKVVVYLPQAVRSSKQTRTRRLAAKRPSTRMAKN